MPSSDSLIIEDSEYWTKLCGLRVEYTTFLKAFIEDLETQLNSSFLTIHNARILQALLQSTPETQNFPCRLELLEAVEARLHLWKSNH